MQDGKTYLLNLHFSTEKNMNDWYFDQGRVKQEMEIIGEHLQKSEGRQTEALRSLRENWLCNALRMRRYGDHMVPADIRNAINDMERVSGLPITDFGPDNGEFRD